MERKTLAKWLVVSALACFGFLMLMGTALAAEGTTVQGTQSSIGAGAVAGPAVGGNASGFRGGPTAAAAVGASSQQLGKNTAKVSQNGTAKVGDAVAGGQVTGVVGDNATVQNSNSAVGAVALTGPAAVLNVNGGSLGPAAFALGTAQSAQTGSNSLDLSQSGTSETGDAVAGAQVTGVVGGGTHAVQNQNSGILAFGLSTPAAVVNLNGAALGPAAASIGPAQAGQVGNNDAVISQASTTRTGDALAGSQVTGGVGGSATVQNSNSCLGCLTATGFTIALNANATAVGPVAASILNAQTQQGGNNSTDVAQAVTSSTGDALSGSQVTGWVGDENGFLTVMNQQASTGDAAFSGFTVFANVNAASAGPLSIAVINAQGSQHGDNDTVVAQAADATTGDALAGAQVTGGVGGDITISGTNAAFATLSNAGFIAGVNLSAANGGPVALALLTSGTSQMGDNSTSLDQSVRAATGDAVSGAQVVGAVASGDVTIQVSNQAALAFANLPGIGGSIATANVGFARGGPVSAGILNAQSSQTGDNKVAEAQSLTSTTGDAVAGGQTVGAVADGDVTVSAQNTALVSLALTGNVLGVNVALPVQGGPAALGILNANASFAGHNDLALSQNVASTTGDAVSGAQVIGSVSGGDTTVQNTNSATLVASVSGSALGLNAAAVVDGPVGIALINGSASQLGDTNVAFAQEVSTSTGDAVAGAAVVGAVADGDVTVSGSNSAFASLGFSGIALGANVGFINGGPIAAGVLNAQAQQLGSNRLAIGQKVTTSTGDAVAGSQITGAVSNDGDIVVAVQNNAILAVTVTGVSAGANASLLHGGPIALSVLNANTSQFGSNDLTNAQEVNSTTGDAVSGAQVTGAVANGSDVTVMGSNSAVGVVALSLPAAGANVGVTLGGPFSFAVISASSSQFGSNHMTVGQKVNATTGDAVAGSQVTGIVAASDGTVTVSNQNNAIGALALSGPSVGVNLALAAGGPTAIGVILSAQAQQTGDNTLNYAQDVSVTSGDAVAGAQVTGVVGGSLAPMQMSNSGLGTLGLSGITLGFNGAGGGLTPTAVSIIGARVQQSGNSDLNGSQNLNQQSGDAVSGGQVSGRVGPGASGAAGSRGGLAGTGVTTGVSTTP